MLQIQYQTQDFTQTLAEKGIHIPPTYISSVQKESSMVRNYSAYKDPAGFLSSLNV